MLADQLDEARKPFTKKCAPSKRAKGPVATPDDLPAQGNCYEKSASAAVMPFGSHKGWDLVHGRPRLTRPPHIEFGHAWLEKGEQVFDPGSGLTVSRASYYALGHVDHRNNFVYTAEEARRFIMTHEHWGPWEGVDAVPMSTSAKQRATQYKPKRSKRSTKP